VKAPIDLPATESLCPECLRRIPALRLREGADIYLVKTCPEHGESKTIIWRGAPDYESWSRAKPPSHPEITQTATVKGCPWDCGLCPEHAQLGCCVLLEVTSRCDLGCPVCFASSGGSPAPDPSLDEIEGWYRLLWESAGTCNIQLSGGEPTMRDDLPEIIAMGRDMGFSFFQLNTNGMRLALNPDYAGRLKKAGLSTVFLQFDGLDDDIYRSMRGAALLGLKQRAIANCAEAGLGVVLVPTLIPGVNTAQVGQIIDFAIQGLPHVRGVHFQPISYFGRYPGTPTDADRYTLPELMRDIEAQTGGLIPVGSFRPSGCEHSLCSFHGDYVLTPGGSVDSIAGPEQASSCCCRRDAETAVEKKRSFVARHWSVDTGATDCSGPTVDATGGQFGDTPNGSPHNPMAAWDAFLDRVRTHGFTITAMAFQDVWNLDLERLRSCCVHVVGAKGRIIPFCSYNLTDSAGNHLHRRVQ
jgi:uncharacterized radical SAM superfamily Fe-S cluster-containing enzyme